MIDMDGETDCRGHQVIDDGMAGRTCDVKHGDLPGTRDPVRSQSVRSSDEAWETMWSQGTQGSESGRNMVDAMPEHSVPQWDYS